MKYVMLAFLTLTACGQRAPVTVDPALTPYMTSFESDIGASTSGISANFADTESQPNPLGETVGECTIYSNGERTIQVDSRFWATLDEQGRKQLMYHELGHCALNMNHITDLQGNNCPDSIMYPVFFGDSQCYSSNLSYYFQELRSHN